MAPQGPQTDKPASAATRREARLKAALKANLARRKAQARAKAQAGTGQDRQQPDESGQEA